jgi:phenylacetate-CoA ligase
MRKYTFLEYAALMAKTSLEAPIYYSHPWMSADHMVEWQTARLKKIIKHAYDKFGFYRDKYKKAGVAPEDFNRLEDLQKFPTIEKEEMIRFSSSLSATGLIESFSSGSSGKVIRVLHDPKDTAPYILGRARILNMTKGLSPFSRTLYIYTAPFPASSFFGLYQSFFIKTIAPIGEIAAYVRQIKPHIISAYPSHLIELAKYLGEDECRRLALRFINVGSELSTRAERDMLEEYFKCPVLDEYSSEELGWIASECPNHNYHLWEDISYIEIEGGEIVGTNLHNYSMPFIRYRQGDEALFKTDSCACGRTSRIFEKIVGRRNDAFVFADGKKLSSGYLLDAFYSILLDLHLPILDFCLIQTSSMRVRLELMTQKPLKTRDIASISGELKKLMPPGVVSEVVFPIMLHRTASGKRNPIVSLVGQSETAEK